MSLEGKSATLDDFSDDDFVEACYRRFLRRKSDGGGKGHFIGLLQKGVSRLRVIEFFLNSEEFNNKFAGEFVPPGHFYSVIPSKEDINKAALSGGFPSSVPGIDLNEDGQLALLNNISRFYESVPYGDDPQPGLRYYYKNNGFCVGDAVILHCMIRHLKPETIIEIGCGFSSCVMLDVNERFFNNQISCSFIEPYPDLLYKLIKPEDSARINVFPVKLQEVDISIFAALKAGDLLFIDSSHVAKLRSDVNRLFFEILPLLKKGVVVHIHDIFYPFEYPHEWLKEGRLWNEAYMLRCFLEFNAKFKIALFNNYISKTYDSWFKNHMPDCLVNSGGSIYLTVERD